MSIVGPKKKKIEVLENDFFDHCSFKIKHWDVQGPTFIKGDLRRTLTRQGTNQEERKLWKDVHKKLFNE